MKILTLALTNFGSYRDLEFNFQNQGLTLIQGTTGAGKSTLFDAISWVLFGQTAKGGKADEVRRWGANGTTIGHIIFEMPNGEQWSVIRQRNPNLLVLNDAYKSNMGKDLVDTQRLINQHLGLDCEQYLSGAYYHEFSQTAQFFTTSAKGRRELCEQLVDLSLATRLQSRAKELDKDLQASLSKADRQQYDEMSKLSVFKRLAETEKTKSQQWEAAQLEQKKHFTKCYDKFEAGRKKTIQNKCLSCGTQLTEPREIIDDSTNPYIERLAELETAVNPHQGATKDFQNEINEAIANIETHEQTKASINKELSDVEMLSEVLSMFRSRLVENTIQYIESQTNEILEKFFDAELTVKFQIIENDKLDVSIQKDGNNAVYTQLSKGQRQLLRLSFSVAVMRALTNHHGVKLNEVFFDEALDGLSDALKIKAFRLFQSIRHDCEGVFVIDHSESLKALFDNQYHVSLVNGESQIAKA